MSVEFIYLFTDFCVSLICIMPIISAFLSYVPAIFACLFKINSSRIKIVSKCFLFVLFLTPLKLFVISMQV